MSYFPAIIKEAFGNGFLFPLSHEPTLFALKTFGGEPMLLPIIVASLAAVAGGMTSYLLGRLTLNFYRNRSMERVQQFRYFFRRYGIWLLPFSFVAIGDILPALAGFAQVRPFMVIALVLAGRLAYYYWQFFA